MPMLLGKTALVTGASRGIGEAIAAAFLREGARVAICARKPDSLQEAAGRLGGDVVAIPANIGDRAQLEALMAKVQETLGSIDILVNNAATNVQQGSCLDITEAQFDKMVDVNLKSAYRLIAAVAPGMAARGSGSIINIASIAGLKPQFEAMLYSMTKAALVMMTKCYALELGPKGVRVNAIAPGLIQTKLSEFFWKDDANSSAFRNQPVRHIGQPSEIAEIAVLLASERASYITGEIIVADGGFLLM